MPTLTSPRNPLIKEIRKAVLRGSTTEDGLAVAESFHLLEEALRSDCEIAGVFAAEDNARGLSVVVVIVPLSSGWLSGGPHQTSVTGHLSSTGPRMSSSKGVDRCRSDKCALRKPQRTRAGIMRGPKSDYQDRQRLLTFLGSL